MTTDGANGVRKIKCFWQTLEEYDERARKRSRKYAFLRFLRRLPEGAGFELHDYHDVWTVYKACRQARAEGEEIKVSVRKTSCGVFKLWVRKKV